MASAPMKKSLAHRVADKLAGKPTCPVCGSSGILPIGSTSRRCDNARCDVRRYRGDVVLESGWLTKEYREGPGNV